MGYTVTETLKEEILIYIGYSKDCGGEIKENVDALIEDGIYRLNEIAGAEVNYDADRTARSLLKDYCRYANAHATEYFEENFKGTLTALHLDYRVKEQRSNETS